MKEYYIELGANGENWDAYGKDIYNGGLSVLSSAVQAWITAKYGSATAQQVVQNPNSDYANQLLQLYMLQMQQGNQQTTSNDKTLLYVALGLGAAALLMMMMDNGKKR